MAFTKCISLSATGIATRIGLARAMWLVGLGGVAAMMVCPLAMAQNLPAPSAQPTAKAMPGEPIITPIRRVQPPKPVAAPAAPAKVTVKKGGKPAQSPDGKATKDAVPASKPIVNPGRSASSAVTPAAKAMAKQKAP